jgi:hypothetical protein
MIPGMGWCYVPCITWPMTEDCGRSNQAHWRFASSLVVPTRCSCDLAAAPSGTFRIDHTKRR